MRSSSAPLAQLRSCGSTALGSIGSRPSAGAAGRTDSPDTRRTALGRLPSCSRRRTTAVSLARAIASPELAASPAASGDRSIQSVPWAMDPLILEVLLDRLAAELVDPGPDRDPAGRERSRHRRRGRAGAVARPHAGPPRHAWPSRRKRASSISFEVLGPGTRQPERSTADIDACQDQSAADPRAARCVRLREVRLIEPLEHFDLGQFFRRHTRRTGRGYALDFGKLREQPRRIIRFPGHRAGEPQVVGQCPRLLPPDGVPRPESRHRRPGRMSAPPRGRPRDPGNRSPRGFSPSRPDTMARLNQAAESSDGSAIASRPNRSAVAPRSWSLWSRMRSFQIASFAGSVGFTESVHDPGREGQDRTQIRGPRAPDEPRSNPDRPVARAASFAQAASGRWFFK